MLRSGRIASYPPLPTDKTKSFLLVWTTTSKESAMLVFDSTVWYLNAAALQDACGEARKCPELPSSHEPWRAFDYVQCWVLSRLPQGSRTMPARRSNPGV